MATVKEKFKEVFGTDPSPELKNRLNLIKNKLQIDDNDSLWILFMGVGYLNEMYVKIPAQIDSQIKNLKFLIYIFISILVVFFIGIFIHQTIEHNKLINNLYFHINENKILTEQLVKLNTRVDLIENNYKNLNNFYNNNNNNGKNNNLSNPTINIDPNKYNNIFPNPNTNNNFNNR